MAAKEQHYQIRVKVIKVQGNAVTTRTEMWSDLLKKLDIAPLAVTEVYLVDERKITHHHPSHAVPIPLGVQALPLPNLLSRQCPLLGFGDGQGLGMPCYLPVDLGGKKICLVLPDQVNIALNRLLSALKGYDIPRQGMQSAYPRVGRHSATFPSGSPLADCITIVNFAYFLI
jgi:hypothetical protein